MKLARIEAAPRPTLAPGDKLRARITNAICRLQDAAERDVPSAARARRIAADLQEALDRPGEQVILNGRFPQYAVCAYIWREYRFAIDNICAEQGGWRSLHSFADSAGGRHPLQSTLMGGVRG